MLGVFSVLNSKQTVGNFFDYISLCFCDWESAEDVKQHWPMCVKAASACFKHKAKLSAIAKCATYVADTGFDQVKVAILKDP